jgi:hypothetical protein
MMFQLKQFVCECWSLHQPSFCPPKKKQIPITPNLHFSCKKGFQALLKESRNNCLWQIV